jgi:hypothetical protein
MKIIRTLPKFTAMIPGMQTLECVRCGYTDTVAVEQRVSTQLAGFEPLEQSRGA